MELTGSSSSPTSVFFELTAELDVQGWAQRYEAGEVPDRSPYGLDRLAAHGVSVTFSAPSASPLVRRVDRRVRGMAGGLELVPAALAAAATARRSAELVACWEEQVGIPAVLRAAVVRQPVTTGVIWLTDRPALPPALERIIRKALPRAEAVWVLSSAMIDPLHRDWGVPLSRLHHLPFGVDTRFFAPNGQQPEPGLVVSAGNDRHRDHPVLVRAVQRLQQDGVPARLDLATRLEVLVPPAVGGARPRHGESEVRALYRRASVVAVATKHNLHCSGLTVALEAMAVGRPVVAFREPGMSDYIRHGETGLLVAPGDEGAFVEALRRLVLDPQEAAALGQAGRAHVEEHHSTTTQAAHLAAILLGAR